MKIKDTQKKFIDDDLMKISLEDREEHITEDEEEEIFRQVLKEVIHQKEREKELRWKRFGLGWLRKKIIK